MIAFRSDACPYINRVRLIEYINLPGVLNKSNLLTKLTPWIPPLFSPQHVRNEPAFPHSFPDSRRTVPYHKIRVPLPPERRGLRTNHCNDVCGPQVFIISCVANLTIRNGIRIKNRPLCTRDGEGTK